MSPCRTIDAHGDFTGAIFAKNGITSQLLCCYNQSWTRVGSIRGPVGSGMGIYTAGRVGFGSIKSDPSPTVVIIINT